MDGGLGILFVVVLFLGVPLAIVIWLITSAKRAARHAEELFRRVSALESDLFKLKLERDPVRASESTPAAPAEKPSTAIAGPPEAPVPPPVAPPVFTAKPSVVAPAAAQTTPPPQPPPAPRPPPLSPPPAPPVVAPLPAAPPKPAPA